MTETKYELPHPIEVPVEHENLIHNVAIVETMNGRYCWIDHVKHRVYPTGNDKEPWTTNLSRSKLR